MYTISWLSTDCDGRPLLVLSSDCHQSRQVGTLGINGSQHPNGGGPLLGAWEVYSDRSERLCGGICTIKAPHHLDPQPPRFFCLPVDRICSTSLIPFAFFFTPSKSTHVPSKPFRFSRLARHHHQRRCGNTHRIYHQPHTTGELSERNMAPHPRHNQRIISPLRRSRSPLPHLPLPSLRAPPPSPRPPLGLRLPRTTRAPSLLYRLPTVGEVPESL